MTQTEWLEVCRINGVSRETFEKINQYLSILNTWRNQLNLVGPNEWDRIWERHVLDSHQLRKHIPETSQIVDFGTGAGFPGIVLAASASGNGHVTLIESNTKKSKFLLAVLEQTKLPISIINSRIESVDTNSVDFVTARAVAPLEKLINLAAPYLETGAVALFHKGLTYKSELENALQFWKLNYKVLPNEYSSNGVIIKISEAKRDRQILSSTRRRQSKRRRR